ncbi:ral guanine nucleotide dissociation stimulator-like isoform X2 [Bos javanicus]|uniref:ral guanine nucleotide dissociation stimulator-like isoform X2 n=1 Tax=Bos javanicus TaxID=9906 RepID=UPI002AA7BC01|nr:ral guanine nucleotide dissociation stimulator-like isoform X2 [Bos javanicus]
MRKVIRRIYRGWRHCLPETGLPRFPSLVPPISEHIPKVHAGIIPSVQVGTRAGFERHMDSSRMENRKPWRERFFGCFRRFSAQLGCLWSFTRRSPKGSSPDCRQELVHGAPCSISLREGPEPHTSNRAQGGHRGESVSTGDRNETYSVWSVRRRRLEMLVDNLVPAFLGGDPAYLPTFLGSYRAFGTPQQVLDLLFMRYGCILPYCDEDGGPLHQLKMAMASILGTWLHLYPEDFQQAPEFPCLKMLLAYVELNMPDSDLEQQARHLLVQLETLEPTEAEGHASAGEEALETSPDLTPTAPLMPATAPQSEQAQSPAPIQVQGLHQVNMPAPNPEPQHAHALALT